MNETLGVRYQIARIKEEVSSISSEIAYFTDNVYFS